MSDPTITELDDRIIAVHEAGHLIVGVLVVLRAFEGFD
jgi:hypothetical protein